MIEAMRPRRRAPRLAGALLMLLVLFAGSAASDDSVSPADFVGSDSCADCHRREFDLWRKSTHGNAGGPPGPDTVIAGFYGTELKFKDAVARFDADTAGRYVVRVKQDHWTEKEYVVGAVIGGGHMQGGGAQTYFVEWPDGTLRYLPFEFIKQEQLWFCQVAGRGAVPIDARLSILDCRDWPPSRVLGSHRNFDLNCHGCHGSQITLDYDAAGKRYVTGYETLKINCESCHGPGRRHVERTRAGDTIAQQEIGMPALATLDRDASIQVCFRCHAGRYSLSEQHYLPGRSFDSLLTINIHPWGSRDFLPDGRIRSFAYQKNHLYSACYVNGSMTCVDCHDPHSQGYRDIRGNALDGRFDDRQCTGCHASKARSVEAHTHHAADSPGSLCTSCHMPYLQHPTFGDRLRVSRSDHTISIPRPAFDSELGLEGACRQCHADLTVEALQAIVEGRYGRIKPHNPVVAGLQASAAVEDPGQAAELLLDPSFDHPVAQSYSLTSFIDRFLAPDMPALDASTQKRFEILSESEDPDLSGLALMGLHLARGRDPEVRAFLDRRRAELGDERVPVERRWGRALDLLGREYLGRGDYDRSLLAFDKALEILPDNPRTLFRRGATLAAQGQRDAAIASYRRAIESDPEYFRPYVHLGRVMQREGRLEPAIAYYESALALRPDDYETHGRLAAAHAGLGRYAEAIRHYERAIDLHPGQAEAHANLGVLLKQRGEAGRAIGHYRTALALRPGDADTLNNLGTALAEEGRLSEAIVQFFAAIKQKPDLGRAHFNLASAFSAIGELDRAIAHFGEAARLEPGNALAHAELGYLLAERGRLEEAIRSLERATALDAADPESRYALGLAWLGKGRRDLAAGHLEQAYGLASRQLGPAHELTRELQQWMERLKSP